MKPAENRKLGINISVVKALCYGTSFNAIFSPFFGHIYISKASLHVFMLNFSIIKTQTEIFLSKILLTNFRSFKSISTFFTVYHVIFFAFHFKGLSPITSFGPLVFFENSLKKSEKTNGPPPKCAFF